MRTVLKSTPRHSLTGGELRQLRLDGFVPVSVSTRGGATHQYTVAAHTLSHILAEHGASALIEMEGPADGTASPAKMLVIARDIQKDPISHRLIHVGFQQLSSLQAITADVRVNLVGHPHPVTIGIGTLEQVVNTLHVKATPDKLPSHIDVDVSSMEIGSVLHVSALPLDGSYEIVSAPETVIAVVQMARAAAAEVKPDNSIVPTATMVTTRQ